MSDTITRGLTFTVIECGECGVPFALSNAFIAERRADHKTWCCPNGHPRWYPEDNEVERLKKEKDRLVRDRDWYAERQKEALKEADRERRRSAAARGQVTKIRNRIANGVCPAPGCKRSGFTDVAAHIASCHPDFHAHEVTA